MKHVARLLIVTAWMSFAFPFAAQAQTAPPAPLPPAAQEALDKGIIAAKVPDYQLAVRFFEDARKLAPTAPVVFMNLGIAESKMPGRELRAMAWFGAYLAAYPDAPNAAAVKDQIAVLEVRNQSNVSRFLKTVQDAAAQMRGYKKNQSLARVAAMWARMEDTSAALKAAGLCGDDDSGKSYAYAAVSQVQAAGGDIAGAQTTAGLILRKTDDVRRDLSYLGDAHIAIAKAKARAGDSAGAQKTFDFVLVNSKLIPASNRSQALEALAKAQAGSGDIAGAQKTVDLMPEDMHRKFARDAVAEQMKSKSINTQASQAFSRRAPTLSDWLRNLDDTGLIVLSFGQDSAGVPLGNALVKDVAGYLKALPTSYRTPAERMGYDKFEKPPEDQRMFDALHEAAEQLIYVQIEVVRMLKAQAGK